jgi:bifunctional UDP-N-acetylglucosamine pyrophosphorylase/glucosamine-1-phosphate N-acetyltransferase
VPAPDPTWRGGVSSGERSTSRIDGAGRPLAAIILAAGKGTRMNSDRPKVAHEVAGRAMVWWVVDAVRRAGAERIVLVIGHGADEVRAVFAGDDDDLDFVVQAEQLGTGHATRCAEAVLADFHGDVLVLAGDGPLIRPETIRTMRARHAETAAAATLATSVLDDPTGYGRVVRDAAGRFAAIVEHRDADEATRAIREVYPSYACYDAALLFECLRRLTPNAASGEYYVTDAPAMLRDAGLAVELVEAVPPEDVLSINTIEQLREVDAILIARMEAVGK